MAYKADTTVTQISRLENDERPGTHAVIVARIAAALGTTSDYLLGLTDYPTASQTDDALDPDTRYRLQELARKLALLDEEERRRITRQYLTLLDFALSLKGLEEPEVQ